MCILKPQLAVVSNAASLLLHIKLALLNHAYPDTKLECGATMEVPLPGSNNFGPESFDHINLTRCEHLLLSPGAQHPTGLTQAAIQRTLLAGEQLQQGGQPAGRPGGDCVGFSIGGYFLQRVDAHFLAAWTESVTR